MVAKGRYGMMGDKVHLLWDLTTVNDSQAPNQIAQRIGLSSDHFRRLERVIEQATVLVRGALTPSIVDLPEHWALRNSEQVIRAANEAIESASDSDAHLLVLLGSDLPSKEAVGMLLETFRQDPHFGVAIPRYCDPWSGDLRKLRSDLGDPSIPVYSRRILTCIPDYYILPEVLMPCFLVRREMIANLASLDESYETLTGALQHYLCRIRRTGFRSAVVNKAITGWNAGLGTEPIIVGQKDHRRLLLAFPDAGIAQAQVAKASLHIQEALLGRLYSPAARMRKSMLLDLRGLPDYINGTVEAVLALCDSLHDSHPDWMISILAVASAATYHDLQSRYPSWEVLTREGQQFFTVALRLSQPWTLHTLIELHNMALLNFYAMLDTISWDILFEASATLEATWTFMADHADGLLFNSFFTQDHFHRRFGRFEKSSYVFHHSFDPKDYAQPVLRNNISSEETDYLLVIGNGYGHKHLKPTVDLLSSAFPYRKIKVIGLRSTLSENVECLASGKIPAAQIDELFAGARLIVFPSFYEGFGFPVLKGLSYGRDVIARRSALLDEIAGEYRGPGRLFGYSTPGELVGIAGQVIHKAPVKAMLLSTALGQAQPAKSWPVIANNIMNFLEEQMAKTNDVWKKRERAVRQLDAYRE